MLPTQPAAGTGPAPSTPAPGTSFREATLARLRSERGETTPPPAPQQAPQPRQKPAPRQPEEDDTQRSALTDDPDPGDVDDGTEPVTDDVDPDLEDGEQGEEDDSAYGEDVPTLHEQLRQRDAEIQRLSRREQEMTRDYTRKTQLIAETRREIEGSTEVVRNTARFLASKIDAPLRQFESVDWANLQAQDPAKYQTTRQQYEQILRARQQFMGELAQIEQLQEQQLEQARQREAQVGIEVLTSRIPGWGPEMYAEVRQFAAEEYGYKPEDLDRNTDFRLVLALRDAHLARKAAKSVKATQRKPAKQAPSTGQARPAFRNNAGQFQTAKQNLLNNPNDKGAGRSYFQAKLAAERKRNGG